MHQLCIASADLKTVRKLLPPEVVTPDRPFRSGRATYVTPDSIAWSPDDRFIAFSRADWFTLGDQRFPGTALYACEVATGRVTELAVHPNPSSKDLYFWFSPQWPADNKHFAYVGLGTHGETNLYVGNKPGSDARSIMGRYDNYRMSDWPVWSPDGRYLAMRQGILRAVSADPVETVHVGEPGGRYARTVFRSSDWGKGGGRRITGESLNNCRVTGIGWSPDNRQLAITTVDDPFHMQGGRLWIVAIDRPSAARQISSSSKALCAPVWLNASAIAVLDTQRTRLRGNGINVQPDYFPENDSALQLRTIKISSGQTSDIALLPTDDFDISPDGRRVVVSHQEAPGEVKLWINTVQGW